MLCLFTWTFVDLSSPSLQGKMCAQANQARHRDFADPIVPNRRRQRNFSRFEIESQWSFFLYSFKCQAAAKNTLSKTEKLKSQRNT